MVRDIMRHTAGIAYGPGGTPAHDAFVKADPLSLDIDLVEMGHRLARVPLLFDPGAPWPYSIAVDVQALLVETLSGQKFAEYVCQRFPPDDRLPRPASMCRKTEASWMTA